jgi:hypothetical protein
MLKSTNDAFQISMKNDEKITKELWQREVIAKLLFKSHNTKLVETMFSSLDVKSDTIQLL